MSGKLSMLRDAARRAGKTKFYSGEPCRNGHVAERFASNGGCTLCAYTPVERSLALGAVVLPSFKFPPGIKLTPKLIACVHAFLQRQIDPAIAFAEGVLPGVVQPTASRVAELKHEEKERKAKESEELDKFVEDMFPSEDNAETFKTP